MINHMFKLRSFTFILTILLLPLFKVALGSEVSKNNNFDLSPISENYLKSISRLLYNRFWDTIFLELSEINPELNVKELLIYDYFT